MSRTDRRSSLFLLELILDLTLFTVCAAVCVGLLVHARAMSRESAMLTDAVYIAQDAAERWRAGETPPGGYLADGTPAPTGQNADYAVTVTETGDRAEVRVYSYPATGQESLYTLTVGRGPDHG